MRCVFDLRASRQRQCQRYLATTPILPHLRCGGIDAAPHPHGLPAKVG
jgi:hypothetical protein